MSEVYAIIDLEGYATQMREAAAKSICDNYNDDINTYISLDQMINLVKNECLGFDDEDRPMLDENSNEKIFDSATVWIHNVGLARLAAKDLVECAWDDTANEMVFWAKENNTNEPASKPKSKRKNKKNKG